MKETLVQLTLRELRRVYSDPLALAVMIGVGAMAGLTGPFGTFALLPLAPRLLYWLLIALGSYGAGLVGAVPAYARLTARHPLALRILILGLGASVPVTLYVIAVSLLFFPDLGQTGIALHELYLYNLAISLGLMTLLEAVVRPRLAAGALPEEPTSPPILDRLPQAVRGRLTHMSMADHYVEVFTERGKALVLMRLADAIAETRGIDGLQIHRSHWVALGAAAGLGRVDGRAVVKLRDGTVLPVSRSHLAAARAAFGSS
ncbi:LytTR family DNA-binding domain-containing protein [Pelagibacterium lacus]|uniref:LytTR family transcriptional regulator n=1 Tax=Pelagibacterium lacus TaxID=2282655 RepID=A0A369W5R2_9HYPH|nr:LytTR family DNA-binding domain-containing protein [Pelagibacterium lacus]RDE09359.1 LytTR family transcriptional regulator [Pelagibacterium lacus]